MTTQFGMGRGKTFPASKARSLLNPARRLVQSPRRMAAQLGVDPDARVVELGCGPGYFSPAIATSVPAGELVLVDLQVEMLALARTRLTGMSNTRFVRADVTRLPIASGTADAVLVVLMLGEVPDRDACVSECRRVLRVGGVALFAESRRDSDFIALHDLRSLVERHDFELGERHGLPWEYTARFLAR